MWRRPILNIMIFNMQLEWLDISPTFMGAIPQHNISNCVLARSEANHEWIQFFEVLCNFSRDWWLQDRGCKCNSAIKTAKTYNITPIFPHHGNVWIWWIIQIIKNGVTFVNGSVVFWDAKSKVRFILERTKRVDCDSHYAYLLNVLLKKLKFSVYSYLLWSVFK